MYRTQELNRPTQPSATVARGANTAAYARPVARRSLIAVLLLGVAYGVGWLSDAFLNDPCVSSVRETEQVEYVERWFPARTDCRVISPSGATRIESGSSEVFLATFALTLVVGLALMSRAALKARAAAMVTAGAAAFLVIFIV
jgi:hypothetical protein